MTTIKRISICLLFLLVSPGWTQASTYQLIEGNFTWDEAKADAERRGGHLAAITTQDEWNVVVGLFGNNLLGCFLGGTDEQQEGAWTWITGEPWSFSNWSNGQPDNSSGVQDYLWLHPAYALKWDDTHSGDTGRSNYYLLEIELPTSRYQLVEGSFSWQEAKADAERRGGHLVTITSEVEWNYVISVLGDSFRRELLWLGANNDNPSKTWNWVTGEKWEFTRWASPSEPSGVGGQGPENYLLTWGDGNAFWNDGTGLDRRGYILENESQPNPPFDFSLGLVAFYPFTANANDESGRGNNGTVNGAVWTTNRFGNPNSSYSFAGDGSHIRIPDSLSLDISDSITIAVWVNLAGGGSDQPRIVTKTVFDLGTSDTSSAPKIFLGCAPVGSVYSSPLSTGNWISVVGTYDRQFLKLYTNGVLAAQVSATGAMNVNNYPVGIGRNLDTGGDRFRGQIDDVRIYSRALSAVEVSALYQMESRQNPPVTLPEPPQPPLINAFTLPRLAFSQIQGLRIPLSPPDRTSFSIETSVDFKTWSPVITFPSNSGPFEFIDSSAVGHSMRFYRAIKR